MVGTVYLPAQALSIHRNWASVGHTLGQHWPLGFFFLQGNERPWALQRPQEAWPGTCGGHNSHQNLTRQLSNPGFHPQLKQEQPSQEGLAGRAMLLWDPTGS